MYIHVCMLYKVQANIVWIYIVHCVYATYILHRYMYIHVHVILPIPKCCTVQLYMSCFVSTCAWKTRARYTVHARVDLFWGRERVVIGGMPQRK